MLSNQAVVQMASQCRCAINTISLCLVVEVADVEEPSADGTGSPLHAVTSPGTISVCSLRIVMYLLFIYVIFFLLHASCHSLVNESEA